MEFINLLLLLRLELDSAVARWAWVWRLKKQTPWAATKDKVLLPARPLPYRNAKILVTHTSRAIKFARRAEWPTRYASNFADVSALRGLIASAVASIHTLYSTLG